MINRLSNLFKNTLVFNNYVGVYIGDYVDYSSPAEKRIPSNISLGLATKPANEIYTQPVHFGDSVLAFATADLVVYKLKFKNIFCDEG